MTITSCSCDYFDYVVIVSRSTFSEFNRRCNQDDRFKAIEKMKDREAMFNDYISELKKSVKQHEEKTKQDAKDKLEKVRKLCYGKFCDPIREKRKRVTYCNKCATAELCLLY